MTNLFALLGRFLVTAVVVCAVGVEQGIILAIIVSLLNIIRMQYKPKDYIVSFDPAGDPTYAAVKPGEQSAPGLIIFRYDAELFYANANRFVDDVQAIIDGAPDPVRWLILDASSLDDMDYSAGKSFQGLVEFLEARKIQLVLARVDTNLMSEMRKYGLDQRIGNDHIYGNLIDAYRAFEALPKPTSA